MEWIRCVRCKKSRCDFGPVWDCVPKNLEAYKRNAAGRSLLRFSVRPVHLPRFAVTRGQPTRVKRKALGGLNLLFLWKSDTVAVPNRPFVARTFALIAPIHTVLHRLSCSYEMIPNAPKHYATHQNMSLGSNGVDWVCS